MDSAMGAKAAPAAAPEIPTGQQKVTDNVTITYPDSVIANQIQ